MYKIEHIRKHRKTGYKLVISIPSVNQSTIMESKTVVSMANKF